MWSICYPSAGGAATMLMLVEPTSNQFVDGVAVDKAPWVYHLGTGASCALATRTASEVYGPMGVLAYGVTRASVAQDAWVVPLAGLPMAVYDQGGSLQVALPGNLPRTPPCCRAPSHAQGTPRCGRRGSLAGTSTGTLRGWKPEHRGDKGECLTIRYSGQTFYADPLDFRGPLHRRHGDQPDRGQRRRKFSHSVVGSVPLRRRCMNVKSARTLCPALARI